MKRVFLFLFLSGILFLVFKSSAFAETIHNFDVDIVAHKDGTMSIKEKINYDFKNLNRHGIFRDIPLYSKVGDLYRVISIDDIRVQRNGIEEKFEVSKNPSKINIKIGNANKEITGAHNYEISYTVTNGIGSNFPDFDEIYWNITGNDWTVPIEKASSNIATDFGVKENRIVCFTRSGNYNAQFCNISPQNSSQVKTTNIINPGEGLTVAYAYPKGTFPPSVLSKELPKTSGEKFADFISKNIVLIYLFLNVVLPIGIIIWYQKHKNKKRFGKPVVNFELPKDSKGERIAPALAGTIDNATLDRDDIVATFFDLAIRKYLKMEEIKTKRNLLPDSKKQKIIKLKNNDNNLNNFEKELFEKLFKDGNEIYADDLKKDFYKTYQEMEKSVFDELVNRKYYLRNPKLQRGLLFFAGLFVLFFGNIILSVVLFFLSRKLIGRTQLGDEIDYKIDGLKLFLKSMDRNYDWQAKKFYTVEQMIPYAMSLGFINEFMEQLKIIKPDYNPTWYSGYHGSFYASYPGFYSAVNSNFTTSAPSSSSGSSGGFSGGGGGGGGGGSW